MTEVQVLTEIYKVAVQAGFWSSFLFPLITSLWWPWWQSAWGRNLMSMDAAIALALLSAVLQWEFGLKPGSTPGHFLLWVTVISLCLVPLIIIWRAVLTFQSQRRGRRGDQNPG